MTAIALVLAINQYLMNGLHPFCDTLYIIKMDITMYQFLLTLLHIIYNQNLQL